MPPLESLRHRFLLAPTASFTSSCTDLSCSFDGSGSSDSDGNIVSYAWDFGDNSTGSGVTPSHTYAAAGTYDVTLTVTDNDNAPGSVSHSVTVTAPTTESPPTDFTASAGNQGPWSVASLSWSGSSASSIDVYRGNGASPSSFSLIATTSNNGQYNDKIGKHATGTYTYYVCNSGSTSACSGTSTVTF
jgi:serine protease